MSARLDQRDVLERVQDIVLTAEFEMVHEGDPVQRCECGATLLSWSEARGTFVCAGCLEVPSYWLHPGPTRAAVGERERGAVPPETSVGDTAARKGAGAPGLASRRRVAVLSAVRVLLSRSLNFVALGWRS